MVKEARHEHQPLMTGACCSKSDDSVTNCMARGTQLSHELEQRIEQLRAMAQSEESRRELWDDSRAKEYITPGQPLKPRTRQL